MIDDEFPKFGEHRGVALHAGQSETRLHIVKGDIDAVDESSDWRDLWSIVCDQRRAPEARLFAGAKLRVLHGMAASSRVERPDFQLEQLDAVTAGLDSLTWADPFQFGSVFDRDDDRPRRERPLDE